MAFELPNIRKFYAALLAVVGIAVVTVALLPFRDYLKSAEIALTLLLVVLLSASAFGSRAGLAASLAGVLSFNFFFLPPYYTLTISDPANLVAFGVFFITSLIAGQLSGYARRRAEESEARQRKIESLYDELRNAFDQASEAEALRRSERLKSALLDAVTHDLRTPLTSIKASVTTLLDTPDKPVLDDEARREFLQIINEETDRLNSFIDGMVGIAKIEADAVDIRRALTSVEEIVGNAIDRARKQLQHHQLEFVIDPDLPQIDVDPISVSQVLFTLLDNAAKYSEAGMRIRVLAKVASRSKVRIVVEDQGRGVPRIDRERVFDKFFQLDENDAGKSEGGLGLGLTIARGMIESQGGRIWIEDGSNDFVTRVVCELPTETAGLEKGATAR